MNNSQRIILSGYLPVTLMLLILDNVYPGQDFVRIIKYIVIITLFISSLSVKNSSFRNSYVHLRYWGSLFPF